MKKVLLIVTIVIGSFAILGVVGFNYMKKETKKASPETTTSYKENGFDLSMTYSSPSVKGRKIFGELVPYGEVWRTGANEPTTFETKTNLMIGGKVLPAGKYTFWTIPNPDSWTAIWNKKGYRWGITFSGEPSRDSTEDVLDVKVLRKNSNELIEKFTIGFTSSNTESTTMQLMWENTLVEVPILKAME